MNHTKIEWVENQDGSQGFTCNPKTGCLNGCVYCYARKLANGRLKERYLANKNVVPYTSEESYMKYKDDPFYPRHWPDRLEQIRRHKKPAGIFLDDMADWMGDYWPEEWTQAELQVMRDCPQHRFYTLTKQPQNLVKWSPFPENCWVGVTATNAKMAEEAGFRLREVNAVLKFISFEPLLERIPAHFQDYISEGIEGIKWVIIGAQTKPRVMPKMEWVEEIVQSCDRVAIPVFLKNNLESMCFALTKSQLEQYTFWETSGFVEKPSSR